MFWLCKEVKNKLKQKVQCRHGQFSVTAAPLISARSRELAHKNSSLRHTLADGLALQSRRKLPYRLTLDFLLSALFIYTMVDLP